MDHYVEKVQMLLNYMSLKAGKVYSIEGESVTKLSWRVLDDENKSKVNLKKSAMGEIFKFVTDANLAEIEIDKDNLQQDDLDIEEEKVTHIQMLDSTKSLAKGQIYKIHSSDKNYINVKNKNNNITQLSKKTEGRIFKIVPNSNGNKNLLDDKMKEQGPEDGKKDQELNREKPITENVSDVKNLQETNELNPEGKLLSNNKTELGEIFKFVTDANPAEIEIDKENLQQDSLDTSEEKVTHVEMLKSFKSLGKGQIYIIHSSFENYITVENNHSNIMKLSKTSEGKRFKFVPNFNTNKKLLFDKLKEQGPEVEKTELELNRENPITENVSNFKNLQEANESNPEGKLLSNNKTNLVVATPLTIKSIQKKQVFYYVETQLEAEDAVKLILQSCSDDRSAIVLDCEGVNLSATGELTVLQVAFHCKGMIFCIVFDVKSICGNSDKPANFSVLKPLLESSTIQKVVHDVHMDAAALTHQFNCQLKNVLDTQLVLEYFTGKMLGSMGDVLTWCNVPPHPNKKEGRRIFDNNPGVWGKRPLSNVLLNYAAQDVICLLNASTVLKEKLRENEGLEGILLQASNMRCLIPSLEAKKRNIGFGKLPDIENENLHSLELLKSIQPDFVNNIGQINVDEVISDLLQLIPKVYLKTFETIPTMSKLTDIIFEVGRRPYAYFGPQKRVFMCEDPSVVIDSDEMKSILEPLENKFGSDNRAGIDRSLHRISAMRSKSGEIYSLTLRVGRAVSGNAGMIKDILKSADSVLIMGSPGSGKTTVIREIANQLSTAGDNVVVVDTSNEICGDGIIPHSSVGMARRMMVPNLNKQAAVLIEAVQNHTPDVIICDEIGRIEEVEAMQTVKERGVRCIASAHGDLRGLVANKQLDGLVGGIETVTVGDGKAFKDQAKFGGQFSKVRQQRGGVPVFDVIIELKPGQRNEWKIVFGVDKAVDNVLSGKTYLAQMRRRDPENGLVSLELVDA